MLLSLQESATSGLRIPLEIAYDPPQKYWRSRNLFKTASGRIGLGPDILEVGDTVVYLANMSKPVVLHQRDEVHLFVDLCSYLGKVLILPSSIIRWRYIEYCESEASPTSSIAILLRHDFPNLETQSGAQPLA